MANDTVITVIGNLTADPEVRFTPSGAAVANFTIASTPRTFDKNSNEWKDGDTLFLRSSIWREAAENVAESLTKGARVIAQGRLKQRSYEKDGQTRKVVELEVDEIGPSLKNASAVVTKGGKGAGGGQPAASGQWGNPQQPQQAAQGAWGNQGAPAPAWGQNAPQNGAQQFPGAPF